MNLTKTLGLAFLGSALLFTSCKKDDDDASNNNPTCKVTKASLFSGTSTTPESVATYTYSGNQLSKQTVDGTDQTFEYSGDKISKRNYTYSTYQLSDQVSYNSDGTISKVETSLIQSGTAYPVMRVDFTYAGGKLTNVKEWSLETTTPELMYEYNYTYTGNNITGMEEIDYEFSETYNYTLTYDSNSNYFKKQSAQPLLTDPFLAGSGGFFIPFFQSANNLTAINDGTDTYPVTYTADDKQNLKDFTISFDPTDPAEKLKISYEYQCQ